MGPDDLYEHLIEGDELLETRLGRLLTWLGLDTEGIREDLLPPVPSGLFSSLLPKPQHCYLAFSEPVDVPEYGDEEMPEDLQRCLREQVEGRVDGLIRDMLLLRTQQRQDEGWLRRLLTH